MRHFRSSRTRKAGANTKRSHDTKYEVCDIHYHVHTKRDASPDAPKSMRVDYYIDRYNSVSEWVCFEHTGYARKKAEDWWRRRSFEPVPDTAQLAVTLADAGALAWTGEIVVRKTEGEPHVSIVGYTLGMKPKAVPILSDNNIPVDELF